MREGVRIGVDVGSVRVGVAACDPAGVIASPVRTLARDPDADADVAEVAAEVRERGAVEVVVGLPLSLDGTEGPAALRAVEHARKIALAVDPVPVRLVDERLSTVDAHRALHAAGRREKQFRDVVDQAAAVVLLQAALDAERTGGRAPGRVLPAAGAPGRETRRKPRHGRTARPAGAGGGAGAGARPDATEGRER
ncbi:Holliday junction resolvase RuvX [Kineococcus indalonis]|uniref:Holliday junction resolvase RuvX n=1 Tax=Kineococcus indalonis TaxID=2696566 RepID=UPI00141310B1|nr:Holliday junction resolvase RuvX [Kineococcus indalonis]NAZ87016.1 Holliday junction resolvase RuvX [Kineococcus indalonis]